MLDYLWIRYGQELKDYTILHTAQKNMWLRGWKKQWKTTCLMAFLRINKSFIVAKVNIKIRHKNKIEVDNIQLPVGRNYKYIVDDFLNKTDK